MTLAQIIATVGGTGYLRPAPGTWGSLVALPLGWVVIEVGGTLLFTAAILLFFVIGIWATAQVTSGKDNHDPSEVVVDELVGQWIALLPILIGAAHAGVSVLALWPGWVAAFVLFRLFDIWKPGPVGWADRRSDAIGVMLDDVIAGVLAALGVMLFAYIAHGIVGV